MLFKLLLNLSFYFTKFYYGFFKIALIFFAYSFIEFAWLPKLSPKLFSKLLLFSVYLNLSLEPCLHMKPSFLLPHPHLYSNLIFFIRILQFVFYIHRCGLERTLKLSDVFLSDLSILSLVCSQVSLIHRFAPISALAFLYFSFC